MPSGFSAASHLLFSTGQAGTAHSPTAQPRKKPREVEPCAQGHIAGKRQSWAAAPGLSGSLQVLLTTEWEFTKSAKSSTDQKDSADALDQREAEWSPNLPAATSILPSSPHYPSLRQALWWLSSPCMT